MSDRYTVISADCHAGADHATYRQYLASAWHNDFDAWRAKYRNPFRDLQDDGRSRNWDDERRIVELDADGIVAEVIFPNTVPPFFPSGQIVAPAPSPKDYQQRLAGLRAHNRWLADFVDAHRGRRAGLGQILLNDVDEALTDVHWMNDHRLSGVLLPGVSPDTPWIEPLFSPAYDPLWAACEDLEMPVTHHSGGSGTPNYGGHPFTNAIFVMETSFFANRALWHLTLSGVFDRFPNLKFVLTEQGSQWVPETLARMDMLWEHMTNGRIGELNVPDGAVTNHKPSDYWHQNCYLGASFPRRADAARFAEIGLDRIMWGSDYPHDEGTYPNSRASLRETFAGWPAPDLRRILAENIASVYGFDLDALAPIAARIGPKASEITPPEA